MKKWRTAVMLAMASLLSSAAAGWCDYIANIQLDPASPASLRFNDPVHITFSYHATDPGGVQILIRPMSAGEVTANFLADLTPLYPAGTGTGTGTLTIMFGEVTVDHLRFQMYNADYSRLILEFYLPVTLHFAAHAIHDIRLAPGSPCSRVYGDKVEVSAHYATSAAGEGRLFITPFTDGSVTAGYDDSSAELLPAGGDSLSGFFTILSGPVVVDQLRLQLFNADASLLLLTHFIPVRYRFAGHAICNIAFVPASPWSMRLGEYLTVAFDYKTQEPGGVRIFATPHSGGGETPGYAVSGSPLYPAGNGSGSANITIENGSPIIDQVRFTMTSGDLSRVLLEWFYPVYYPFAPHTVNNIAFTPPPPAWLTAGEDVQITFDYTANTAEEVLIFTRPVTDGSATTGFGGHASPYYPAGSGHGTGSYHVNSGSAVVDHTHIRMYDYDQSDLLLDFMVPSLFYYGDQSLSRVDARPTMPQEAVLAPNYPNPFNAATRILFSLPQPSPARLEIFTIRGEHLRTLLDAPMTAGRHFAVWDGCDAAGIPAASGVYLCRLSAGPRIRVQKMTLLR